MPDAKRRLTEIKVNEISFVDKAANKKNYLILKADEQFYETVKKACEQVDKQEICDFIANIESIKDENYSVEEVKKFFPAPFLQSGLMNPFQVPGLQSLTLLQQLASFLSQLTQQPNDGVDDNLVGNNYVNPQDSYNGYTPEPDLIEKKVDTMTQEEIQKSIESAVAEAVQKAQDELNAANAKLALLSKALEDQKAKEFADKAEKLAALGVDKEFGNVLKALHVADAENYAKVEELLFKAVDAISKEDLTKEVGTDEAEGQGRSSSVDDLVNARADEVQKAHPTLTRSQAIDKALELLISENKV